MMKKAFVVTSIIDLTNDKPLTYSPIRTVFSAEDRLRHTVFTLNTIDLIDIDNSTIFLVDSSDNWENYFHILCYQKNLVFVSVKNEFPEVYETIRTYPNKSHGEALIMTKFFEKYAEQLADYDYVIKLCGRYFTNSSVDISIFNEQNQDKVFFKKPLVFEWNDNWAFDLVDRRQIQQDNTLRQYCSVMYGWGRDKHREMIDVHLKIREMTGRSEGMSYDMETLLYFYTRSVESSIIETDWIVFGWDATSGRFMRY